MSSPPAINELTDEVLAGAYDHGSFQRGVDYANQQRTTLFGSKPGTVKGLVKGSGRQPYLVEASWFRSARGIVIADQCSCPLGGACKHCVAVLLAARRKVPPPVSVDWRRKLARIANDEGEPRGAGDPLALEIVMSKPAPSRYLPPQRTLPTLRPLRLGKKGKWIKTGASWREIITPYFHSSDNIDETHRAALKALFSGAGNVGIYADAGPISLSRFGPDIWFHLEHAVEIGICLVGAGNSPGRVTLSSLPARVTIDLIADADGAVTVTTQLTLDDEPVTLDSERTGLIGEPAHGLYTKEHGALRLIPLVEPLHPDLTRLLTAPPLEIPPEDADEFLDGYQPMLARFATVGSSDGSVEIVETELDGLVVTIERTAVDAASLHWGVRYRRGARTIDHPLHATIGRDRDEAAERRVLDALEMPTHLMADLADPIGAPRDLIVVGRSTVILLSEVVPWFVDRDQVAVEVTGDLPDLREATEDPLISLAISDTEETKRDGTDWFDLAVEVSVDGEHVEFSSLFSALTRDEEILVLPSGTWLRLDLPELAKLRELIDEARGLDDHPGSALVRINRFQSSWWEDLAALGVITSQSDRWSANVAHMRNLTAPEPVETPAKLAASLRAYQKEGLDWLAFLHRNHLGGILADDMGLGKTVQTLALCLHVLAQNPDARFLVVAPTSVVDNWRHEAAQFTPEVQVQTIHETAARRGVGLAEAVGDASIVVTSYALFRIEFEAYQELEWELLLLDEAQFVKNHKGKTYQCVRRLDVTVKIAITGTPLENSLMDLWSLLSITAPGLYPNPKRFSEVYRKPIESGEAPEVLGTLRRRIAPLMRRRTKDAVLTELPPKTEQVVEVQLSARHARIYQTQLQRQRQKVLGLVGDVQQNRFEILKSLTLLRQLSLDPGLVDPANEGVGSAKLDRLVEDLSQVLAEGHRALVFSQFTRYLARVRTRLDEAGIAHAYLDGRTRNRDKAISAFKDGDLPVFVISLKAGGFGLNLTEADYCFVLDPWWNPATETQAVDRTHRIGQRNAVVVYRYVSTGTIEEKVMELKARKAALFSSVMDAEGALSGALTADDIRGLLDLSD